MKFVKNRRIYFVVVGIMLVASPFVGRYVRTKVMDQQLSKYQVDLLVHKMKINSQLEEYVDEFIGLRIKGGITNKDLNTVTFPAVIEENNNVKHDVLIVFQKQQSGLTKPTVIIYGSYPFEYKKVSLGDSGELDSRD